MKERLNALENDLSMTAADMFADELAEIDDQTEISNDAEQRILSSVMRKAGFEMKEKRTKKRTISIAVIAAAAACLCGFTAFAVFQYNYGNAFKSKLADRLITARLLQVMFMSLKVQLSRSMVSYWKTPSQTSTLPLRELYLMSEETMHL